MKKVNLLLASLGMVTLAFMLYSCGNQTPLIYEGAPGQAGAPGTNGSDGVSCSVITVDPSPATPNGGAQITCGSTITILVNGAPGIDGVTPAAVAYQVVDIIDPCGDASGINDEVFLRLQSGRLLASFSETVSGQNTRFSLIEPGSYVTTDNSHCNFTVNSDYSISNEHY